MKRFFEIVFGLVVVFALTCLIDIAMVECFGHPFSWIRVVCLWIVCIGVLTLQDYDLFRRYRA